MFIILFQKIVEIKYENKTCQSKAISLFRFIDTVSWTYNPFKFILKDEKPQYP